MRGETMNREPIAEVANGSPTRSRRGGPQVPFWNRTRIGLLSLGIIALPWLPIDRMPGDPTPARRLWGLGDNPILGFAFAPDGATIATIQWDGRVALRDVAGGV